MTKELKLENSRRSFLKALGASSAGLLIGFNYIGCKADAAKIAVVKPLPMPSEWIDFDAFIKIGDTGLVTIMSQNPEIGQNIKTSMPMIVAEELDVAWKDVVVEQAPYNADWYERQVAGGSQSIRSTWETLRNAGAKVRHILVETAAEKWEVDFDDCSVSEGVITHSDGRSVGYGDIAKAASTRELPAEVKLKDPADFKIVGHSQSNVDMEGILRGKPLFGIDYRREGMLYSAAVRPPSFGQVLGSFDDAEARKVTGVVDVFKFGDKIAVTATNNWAAKKGAKLIKAKWSQKDPAENSAGHTKTLMSHLDKRAAEPRRVDGDIDKAFAEADEIIEQVYEAPFLPHNCMEPMNFFANVTDAKVEMVGPIQTPAWTSSKLAKLLGRDEKDISIDMTRMGGGFGRRLYGDFAEEAALISQQAKKPVLHLFSREDDMNAGTYRPASAYKFKVAIKDKELTAYHLTEAFFNGEMFGQMPSNFPCGAVPNYRVDCHKIESNLTTGAWRAPYANFLAFAEQTFLDELAEHLEIDAVQFRLDLLEKARKHTGEEFNYEIDKFIGVIKLAAEKSNWGKSGANQGFCAYYSHNTYVAEVAEVEMSDNEPVVKKVYCAVDCGIVVNPIGALNQVEGGIVDGIGHALYGDFSFENGRSEVNNFDRYRMIRMAEAPEIEVHFVKNLNSPTGLGEPTLPPAGGALANAIHAATGKRLYKQPFVKHLEILG